MSSYNFIKSVDYSKDKNIRTAESLLYKSWDLEDNIWNILQSSPDYISGYSPFEDNTLDNRINKYFVYGEKMKLWNNELKEVKQAYDSMMNNKLFKEKYDNYKNEPTKYFVIAGIATLLSIGFGVSSLASIKKRPES